jgi:hypothetical protein
MRRFIDAKYAFDEQRAVMVGYVQADDPEAIVAAIRVVLEQEEGLGPAHSLLLSSTWADPIRLASEHQRVRRPGIRLRHFHVDTRPVP